MHITGIAIYIALSFLVGLMGIKRNFGFWGYFFGSILLTPAVGLILVLASGKKKV